jgi:hypothetical protein
MISENGRAIYACMFLWACFTEIAFEVKANHAVLLDEMQTNEAICKVMYFLNCQLCKYSLRPNVRRLRITQNSIFSKFDHDYTQKFFFKY